MGLKPFTSENARSNQAKGVLAARRKKDIALLAAARADTPVSSGEEREKLALLGIPEDRMTCSTLVAAEVFRRAARGSPAALRKWEEWMARAAP